MAHQSPERVARTRWTGGSSALTCDHLPCSTQDALGCEFVLFPAEGLLAAGLDLSAPDPAASDFGPDAPEPPAAGDIVAIFAGAHDASALAVVRGDCDAGFVYDCASTATGNDCSFTDEAGSWGFAARDDSFYDGIRKVCEATGAAECD